MENRTLEAVDKLTHTWSRTFGPAELGDNQYRTVSYEPLLDTLRAALHSSPGKSAAGASSDASRNPFNLRAFDMWEHIDGLIRAWGRELEVAGDTDVKTVLRRVYVKVAALGLDDMRPARFARMVTGWVAQIQDMFDPPTTKELIGDCPQTGCGQRYVKDEHGDLAAALIAYYRQDEEPEAKCRACGAVWSGVMALRTLGFGIKARVDDDELREMGFAV